MQESPFHSLRPDIAQIKSYLRLLGWEEYRSGPWDVFVPSGEDVELALPRSDESWEQESYAKTAIAALAASYETTVWEITTRIHYQERDVIRMRLTESDELDLADAAHEIRSFERLVRDAAANEYKPRPHYTNRPRRAEEITKLFQFGHTYAGSFGLTIASSKLWIPQRSLFDELGDPVVLPPFARRVVERILRGLENVASDVVSDEELASQFNSGYNANMLSSLGNLIERRTTEFDVIWSLRVPVAQDLAHYQPIQVGSTLR